MEESTGLKTHGLENHISAKTFQTITTQCEINLGNQKPNDSKNF